MRSLASWRRFAILASVSGVLAAASLLIALAAEASRTRTVGFSAWVVFQGGMAWLVSRARAEMPAHEGRLQYWGRRSWIYVAVLLAVVAFISIAVATDPGG